jgi:hypothetical protein
MGMTLFPSMATLGSAIDDHYVAVRQKAKKPLYTPMPMMYFHRGV